MNWIILKSENTKLEMEALVRLKEKCPFNDIEELSGTFCFWSRGRFKASRLRMYLELRDICRN